MVAGWAAAGNGRFATASSIQSWRAWIEHICATERWSKYPAPFILVVAGMIDTSLSTPSPCGQMTHLFSSNARRMSAFIG
jgi:hypothetical protein